LSKAFPVCGGVQKHREVVGKIGRVALLKEPAPPIAFSLVQANFFKQTVSLGQLA
jgi:hypothetical protein